MSLKPLQDDAVTVQESEEDAEEDAEKTATEPSPINGTTTNYESIPLEE